MPGVWKSRHRLLLCWLILLQAVFPGRKTLKELSRWAPSGITDWRFRRLLKAGYWSIHLLLTWWAQEVLAGFPPPENGVLYLRGFTPPTWAKLVIVGGDAAYGAKDNMKMVQRRDRMDPHRQWAFVFGIARTWKTEDGHSLKDLVTHLPHKQYQRTWIPRLVKGKRRKTFWTYGKHLSLRHIGDVTVVLSKKGRNLGPKNTKLIVTNLTELTPRQILLIYQRRWSIELLMWELKSALGLGQHQVTRQEERVEKSIGIALLAYLFLLRACPHQIQPGQAWSIFQLQQEFRLKVFTHQVEHNMELKMKKQYRMAS